MRRGELEIVDRAEIEAILARATVCRLALSVDDLPYIVPLTFAYEDGAIYLHSSYEGRKMEMLAANPSVCFEVDVGCEPVTSGDPCRWHMKYESVIGFGRAVLVEDPDGKKQAMEAIRDHYAANAPAYGDIPLDKVAVVRIDIESMTGRRRPV